MRNINLIVFFVAVVLCSAFNEGAEYPKSFVGYFDNYPVFDSYKEKKLYILKDRLEFFVNYPTDYTPIAVRGALICYEERSKTGCSLVFSSDNLEKKYPLNSKLTYAALDEKGTLFYTDIKDGLSIKSVSMLNNTASVGVVGYVICIVDGFLYYSKEHDSNLVYANADIFVLNTKLLSKPQMILSNVSGECTVIFSNRKYIYEKVLRLGKFSPIIYSIEKKKYKEIKLEKNFLNSTPFYSFQSKSLVFYDYETMDMRKVAVSDSLDI